MTLEQGVRRGLVVAGLAVGLFGLWSLLRLGLLNLFWTALWLAGGVLGHDGLLAGLAIVSVAVGTKVLPPWARASAAVGFVVLTTITVMAIPVLGRFGALPDNPSLLDRSYGVGWLVFAGIVAVGVAAAAAVSRRRDAPAVKGGHG